MTRQQDVVVAALAAVLALAAPVSAQQPADQRRVDSLAAEVRALKARLDSLRAQVARGPAAAPARRDTAATDELAALRDGLPAGLHARVGFCLDTAHLHAAGYEVATALEAVWEQFDQVVGLAHLKCLHLNDSKGALGSHLDRHQWIGEGTIGPEPFRRIMRDPRLAPVIKIIETPKGDDPIRHDRRMLRRLRAYARSGATVGPRKP